MKKRSLMTMAVALGLTAVIGIGATLAYMTDATAELTNTFTVGHVDIDLDEPSYPGGKTGGEIKGVYPGQVIPKDPTVTVKAGSEKAYIYMKVVGIDAMIEKGYMVCSEKDDTESMGSGTPINTKLWKPVQVNGGSYDGIYRYIGEDVNIKAKLSEAETKFYDKDRDITICKATTNGTGSYELPPLFNKVIYKSSQEGGDEASGTITVKAAAIQADGLNAEEIKAGIAFADKLAIGKLNPAKQEN